MVTVLFPGRHHILTKFQHQYLKNLVSNGVNGKKVTRIIFAVTSSNHENTRRNPVPFYLRAMAITKFAEDLGCEVKIYHIPDIKYSERFAKYIISQIFYQSGEKISPKDCFLACSTPDVLNQFKKLGFKNLPVELINEKTQKYSSLRPFEIIELIVKAGSRWKQDSNWKNFASEASSQIYLEYNLGDLIVELFNDSLLNEDADITETRDYNTYAQGMDKNAQFKFDDIRPFVVNGKIVDVGCGTGALINLLAKEFSESDIIGIEATRKFYEYCRMQEYSNPFVFFYRKNILDQNFKENTINTFIYSSILHEVYSYIGKKDLLQVIRHTYSQLASKGRIIIRDVVGPKNPDKEIYMELNEKDGKERGEVKELSTYSRFFKFAEDFLPRKIKYKKEVIGEKRYIVLSIQDAYEFISKMNYTDNWKSEMHEEFGFWSFDKWKEVLKDTGFDIVAGSKEFKSDYIIDKMYKGRVQLFTLQKGKLVPEDFPATNMILSGEKS